MVQIRLKNAPEAGLGQAGLGGQVGPGHVRLHTYLLI